MPTTLLSRLADDAARLARILAAAGCEDQANRITRDVTEAKLYLATHEQPHHEKPAPVHQ